MQSIAKCIAPGWGILHNYDDASNGRIWLLWDQNFYDVIKLQTSSQLLQCLVQDRSMDLLFLLTVIYGFNTIELRRTLWDELAHISPGISQPWLLAGDFNALLGPQDRLAGATVTLTDTRVC